MRKLLVLVPLLFVAACGGSTNTVTETVTVTDSTAAAPAETTETAEQETPADDTGTTQVSGGIRIKLLKVSSSRTITYQGGTQSDETPNGTAVTKKAPQGGRYVYVRTTVTNKTSGGIDITCSWPIKTTVNADDATEFDPIESLYLIAGNPECNDSLQPGFKDTVTWVFLIPSGTQVTSFVFTDVTDFNAEEDPATFYFPAVPKR